MTYRHPDKQTEYLPRKSLIILGVSLVLAVIAGVFSAYLPAVISLGAVAFLVVAAIIWRNPFVGLLIIAFFLPLERIGAYEYSELTIRLSQIFLIITGLVWFLKGVVQKKLNIAKNPLVLPGLIFICINIFINNHFFIRWWYKNKLLFFAHYSLID